MHGGLRDLHVVRRSAQEEIDIVDRAISRLHIDAREVFAAAKTRKAFFMHLEEVKREIFAVMFRVKLLVTRFCGLCRDVFLNPGRNLSHGDFPLFGLVGRQFHLLRRQRGLLLLRMFRVLPLRKSWGRSEEECNNQGNENSCNHEGLIRPFFDRDNPKSSGVSATTSTRLR